MMQRPPKGVQISDMQWDAWINLAKKYSESKDPNKIGLNILLFGDPGCGKTSMVKQAIKRAGLKSICFSGALTDPWIEIGGIPRSVQRHGHKKNRLVRNPTTGKLMQIPGKRDSQEKHNEFFLEFIRPSWIKKGIQVIFIDEFNRAPKKTLNALMQLINEHHIDSETPIPSLFMVIAACNYPNEDQELNFVNELDDAMLGRFQKVVHLSVEPKRDFFLERYVETLASGALEWYYDLSESERKLVSPRDLQYALDSWKDEGCLEYSLNWMLGPQISRLASILAKGSPSEKAERLLHQPLQEQEKFFRVTNNYVMLKSLFINGPPKYLPLLEAIHGDDLSAILSESEQASEYVASNFSIFEDRLSSSPLANGPLIKRIFYKKASIDRTIALREGLQEAYIGSPNLAIETFDAVTKMISPKGELSFNNDEDGGVDRCITTLIQFDIIYSLQKSNFSMKNSLSVWPILLKAALDMKMTREDITRLITLSTKNTDYGPQILDIINDIFPEK